MLRRQFFKLFKKKLVYQTLFLFLPYFLEIPLSIASPTPCTPSPPQSLSAQPPPPPPQKNEICTFVEGYCHSKYSEKIEKNFSTIEKNIKKINESKNKLSEKVLEDLNHKINDEFTPLYDEIKTSRSSIQTSLDTPCLSLSSTSLILTNVPTTVDIQKVKDWIIKVKEAKDKTYNILSWLCEESKKKAISCCQNPSNCLFQIMGAENPGLNVPEILGSLAVMAQKALSDEMQSDIKAACIASKTMNLVQGSTSASLSGLCFTSIESCVSFCDREEEQLTGTSWETNLAINDSQDENRVIRRLVDKASECRDLRLSGGGAAVGGASAIGASFLLENCDNIMNDQNDQRISTNTSENFWGNYCENNPTSPMCSRCLDPTTSRDSEECQNLAGSIDLGSQDHDDPSDRNDFTTNENQGADPNQDALDQKYQGNSGSLAQSSRGASGGGSGSSGGGLGFGGSGASGGGSKNSNKNSSKSAKDKGYDTDILGGIKKGGGFGYSTGFGSSSYSKNNRSSYNSYGKSYKSKKKKFSLKDFLPKAKNKASNSKRRSKNFFKTTQHKNRHQNIFFKHSKRVQRLCSSKILYCN